MGERERARNIEALAVPEAPVTATEKCELVSLSLEEVPPSNDNIIRPPRPNASEFDARIAFNVNGDLMTFALEYNPSFIALPLCLHGPHVSSSHKYTVVSISDLKESTSANRVEVDLVLVINATCPGGEAVARAWCAEFGHHAVIRRSQGACFGCAVEMAGREGLGVGCLIWS